jgi:hypothetical protein
LVGQELLESSPSYAPIKRLFESYYFCPPEEDILSGFSSDSFFEEIEDESTLKKLAKQKLVSSPWHGLCGCWASGFRVEGVDNVKGRLYLVLQRESDSTLSGLEQTQLIVTWLQLTSDCLVLIANRQKTLQPSIGFAWPGPSYMSTLPKPEI